jgi:hypothetical protein
LRLGGSRRFDDRQGYEAFVEQIVSRMNARVFRRLAVEQPMLKLLPVRRTAEYEELPARVSKYANFHVKSEQYSALSQLIGRRMMVRRTSKHIECWLGGQRVLRRDRAVRREGWRHARDIDYRHLVAALQRKLGAFAHGVLRDAAFPLAIYKKTWERLHAATTEREACKTMVGRQVLAADGHEARPADGLEQLIELNPLPDLQALTELRAGQGRSADRDRRIVAAGARPPRVRVCGSDRQLRRVKIRTANVTSGSRRACRRLEDRPFSSGQIGWPLSGSTSNCWSRPGDEFARSAASRPWRHFMWLEMPTFAPRAPPPVAETPRCACGKIVDLQPDRGAQHEHPPPDPGRQTPQLPRAAQQRLLCDPEPV